MSAESPPVLQRTPLHEEHVGLGGRMIDFGGWSLPVQYAGIMAEHQAVRRCLGVFDISHMGQFFAEGPKAAEWLNGLLSNNVARLGVGECQYSFLLNECGGVIDDLIVYRLEEARFLLVVNAARIAENAAWLEAHRAPGVEWRNASAEYAGVAVQGPRAANLFDAFFGQRYARPARNEILTVQIDGGTYYIARTGYTGEDGFEVFCAADRAVTCWRDILERGRPLGLEPCGLGARDTLRLEMCYPLNGSDLSPERTPLEAGLSIFVDLEKGDFIGRDALRAQKAQGPTARLAPFKMALGAPPPRPHYPVYAGGERVAETTSATLSPSLGVGIGMAYLPAAHARIGEQIEIEIRGRRFPATIERKPLYRPSTPNAAPANSFAPA